MLDSCRVPTDGYQACLWEKPQGENSDDSTRKNVGQFYWMSRAGAGGVGKRAGSQKLNYFANGPFWAQVDIRNPGNAPSMGLPRYQGDAPYYEYGLYSNPGGGSSSGAGYQGNYYRRRVKRTVPANSSVSNIANSTSVNEDEYEWIEVPPAQGLRGWIMRLARVLFGGGSGDPAFYTQNPNGPPAEPFRNKTLILEDGRKIEHHALKVGDAVFTIVNDTAVGVNVIQEL